MHTMLIGLHIVKEHSIYASPLSKVFVKNYYCYATDLFLMRYVDSAIILFVQISWMDNVIIFIWIDCHRCQFTLFVYKPSYK